MMTRTSLYLIALLLVVVGTIFSIATALLHLIEAGLLERFLLILLALSLVFLGAILLVIGAYWKGLIMFDYFAMLMVVVLMLGATAFQLLSRAVSQ